MKKQFFSSMILTGILLMSTLQGAASASVVVDRVVAVVNDEIITLSDLQREEALKKNEALRNDRLVLEDMIDRKLQMAAAKRAGVDVTDKELADAVADITKRNGMDMAQFDAALEGRTYPRPIQGRTPGADHALASVQQVRSLGRKCGRG